MLFAARSVVPMHMCRLSACICAGFKNLQAGFYVQVFSL